MEVDRIRAFNRAEAFKVLRSGWPLAENIGATITIDWRSSPSGKPSP